MMPMKLTPESRKLLEAEADLRAKHKTNKQLAELTGLSTMYVANLVAKFRRVKCLSVDIVPRETPANVNE